MFFSGRRFRHLDRFKFGRGRELSRVGNVRRHDSAADDQARSCRELTDGHASADAVVTRDRATVRLVLQQPLELARDRTHRLQENCVQREMGRQSSQR